VIVGVRKLIPTYASPEFGFESEYSFSLKASESANPSF